MANFNGTPLTATNLYGKEIDCTQIADVWHIIEALPKAQFEALEKVWTQAHAMQDELLRVRQRELKSVGERLDEALQS